MKASHNYEVIVVGAGISGLSTAWHLHKLGVADLAIISQLSPEQETTTSCNAGLVSGTYFDNFTRFENTFGIKKAKAYWQFGLDAFEKCETFCQANKIAFKKGLRRRVILSEHETDEAKMAVKKLQQAGFHAKLTEYASYPSQEEGVMSAYLQTSQLTKKLFSPFKSKRFFAAGVKKLNLKPGGIEVVCDNRKKLHCEIVVLATHLGTAKLLPELEEVFVSTHDQWLEAELPKDCKIKLKPGEVMTFNHGHEWLVALGERRLRMGGARFLLPHAGTGLKKASYSPKIHDYISARIQKIFALTKPAKITRGAVGLECRPCDELPVIGPMYGEGRILLAAGYSGQGLSLGFLAGECLADLIFSGANAKLPRDFWPTRLRSLRE